MMSNGGFAPWGSSFLSRDPATRAGAFSRLLTPLIRRETIRVLDPASRTVRSVVNDDPPGEDE